MRKSQKRRREGLDVKMTPMIDVVFLLLVFFVWTASFEVAERLLPSDVAQTEGTGSDAEVTPELMDFEQVVVHILATPAGGQGPSWKINDRPLATLREVRDALDAIAAIKSDLPVIVDPSGDVPLGHVIDVYDISRLVGFSTVHFTAITQ